MSNESLYISFGPVQSYVSEARTTRDLWAGSSLLALLAESALRAAAGAGAEPVSPLLPSSSPDSPLSGHASVPNVMQLDCKSLDPQTVASVMIDRWNSLWRGVCDEARQLLERASPQFNNYARSIWDRQQNGLWYCVWVTGAYDNLRARKSIRQFNTSPEQGWKCSVCGSRQAIALNEGTRRDMKDFWQGISTTLPSRVRVREEERLCAICFTKRALSELVSKGKPKELSRLQAESFPSTVDFAAVTWLKEVVHSHDTATIHAAKRMLESLRACKANRVKALTISLGWGVLAPDLQHLLDFSSDYYYSASYATRRLQDHEDADRKTLRNSQKALQEAAKKAGILGPSSYCAVLLMDGDNMGKILSENERHKSDISKALNDFADTTHSIVESMSGQVVYAGGDDLLAFLPLGTVLDAALELRIAYASAMSSIGFQNIRPTISAGITLANTTAPLRQVVTHTHHLLDDVAKEHRDAQTKTMKDAFAVQVWNRSGPGIRLVRRWDSTGNISCIKTLRGLIDAAQGRSAPPLTSGFLYKTSELFEEFGGGTGVIESLLFAEYFASRTEGVKKLKETEQGRAAVRELIDRLLKASRREDLTNQEYDKNTPLMIRFMASGGVNE
ncbi:MAG: type III-B CRISPR-associated protein Cas10/Cmr2 [Candidatus Thorarchaeota archaeon]|nr:type III-B CRISPR-associated protein Cas10/Cmr2 [Candidatus Thorarchaeota archaeon]